MNKTVLTSFTILCLLSTVLLIGLKIFVKGSSELPVHNIDTGLDYAMIQDAIDAPETLDGHTIFVEAGTYCEPVVVDKTISLIGENGNSIVEGNKAGIGLFINANNTYISGLTVRNYYFGIWFNKSEGNNVASNTITNNTYHGMLLDGSSGNILRNNIITGSMYNFGVRGWTLQHFIQDIDVSNTVDGKPVFYLTNQTNLNISPLTFPEIGYLALVNSTNVTVKNLILAKSNEGLLFAFTTNSSIENVTVENNYYGIVLYESDHNTITGNSIRNNKVCGIGLYRSGSNKITGNNITHNRLCGIDLVGPESIGNCIYHNNFYNRIYCLYPLPNTLDNGYPSGGNYWYGYTGVDEYRGPYQNETGSDGIGDTPYVYEYSQDVYPLMGPISLFEAITWNEITYCVDMVSNSTISDFYFDPDEGPFIRFNVTGPDFAVGFCRVTIPNELLWCDNQEQWTVLVNNTAVLYRIIENGNYTYLYFNYSQSTQNVQIEGIHVIPEFPPFLILPLFILATLLTIIVYRRKHTG